MSLTFKLLSLVVRTAAKPIGNYIKQQAREHDGFRRFAITQAQRVHRVDMRMRLGLLHDAESQQRMHDREVKAAEERKKKAEAPTVRSEEEQKKYDEQQARDGEGKIGEAEKEARKEKEKAKKIKIRPLTDARAIELGANFFSEAFIFGVAVGLIIVERWRSSRDTGKKRDEVAERLEALEASVERLQQEHHLPELEALNEKLKRSREERNKPSWYNPAGWWRRTDPDLPDDDDEGIPGEVEAPEEKRISGSVPGPPPAQAIKVDSNAPKEPAANASGDSKARAAPGAATVRVDSVEATKKER